MRKICVFTSTRADYGILSSLMKEIKKNNNLVLQVFATGTHFDEKFGNTYQEILNDGLNIDVRIPLPQTDTSALSVCRSQGEAIQKFAEALNLLRPDIAIVLGDRFEALSFAIACTHLAIPLAHLHGGELTLGAVDDSFRHAITKLSYWHFTAASTYQKRVIRLGEAPERVFNVGSLAVETISKLALLTQSQIEEKLKIKFNKKNVLVTFHPETNTNSSPIDQARIVFSALEKMDETTTLIITMPNIDTGSELVLKEIEAFIAKNNKRAYLFPSLGYLLYFSVMNCVDMVVGNSSSGIVEAPSFGLPTVNIGKRQEGRMRAETIIDCEIESSSIDQALKLALKNGKKKIRSPFAGDNTAIEIVKHLEHQKIPENLVKQFYEG